MPSCLAATLCVSIPDGKVSVAWGRQRAGSRVCVPDVRSDAFWEFCHAFAQQGSSEFIRLTVCISATSSTSPCLLAQVVPPASAPHSKIRPSQGADAVYDPVGETVQGHRHRAPSWQLPPNHTALSQQWISAAALAYV